jgi:pimeloyl-ACP methyl ester carboxylesterase
MAFFTTRGVRLHYQDSGHGVPLLLLHAFPLSGALFEGQVTALAGRARCVVPDLCGFGQSALGEGPTTMEQLAQDALALLDHLGIATAVVGGISLGGYASLALLRHDPGRVRGLLLADTQMGADDDAGRAGRETLAQDVLAHGADVLVERLLPRLLSPSAPEELRTSLAQRIRATQPAAAAAALRGMALRPDSRDILSRFSGPVLVAVGTEDVLTPPAKAREMVSVAPQASLVEIPGAGHLANLEAPGPFNASLAQFLLRWPA